MSTLADSKINVFQAVNLTIGTSAFLGLADSLSKSVVWGSDGFVIRVVYAVVLAAWAVKLLIENHGSFATAQVLSRPRYAVFQLAMAVSMMVCLTVAAKQAHHLVSSASWLAASMMFGIFWLFGLALFHKLRGQFSASDYPWHQLASAVFCGIAAFAIAHFALGYGSTGAALAILSVVVVMLIDFKISNSFSVT